MVNNLANQLREGTSKSHSMAENVSFVKSFLGGVINKESYKQMISNLYFVYITIEEEMDRNKEHPALKSLYFPELNRKESLEQDLAFYYGEDWESKVTPSPATLVYANRITEVGKNHPELLIAHAYTRYLGDLSGGQILKNIAQRSLNLPGEDGLAFYNFTQIEDEQAFKTQYKANLDSLPLDQEEISQVITEANVAFGLNMKMFQELEASILKIATTMLLNFLQSLKEKLNFRSIPQL
nr:heme oxygenase [Proteomonas sp. NIES-1005]